jgi:hypothetical protein
MRNYTISRPSKIYRKRQNCQPQARRALARQIEHTDAEIDRLVYELYGLTDEEIALVEAATK